MQEKEMIAWAAGLFEGEGCIRSTQNHSISNYPRLHLSTTDEDVIRRFRDVIAYGKVSGPYYRENYKPIFYWSTSGRNAHAAIVKIFPYLLSRRKAKAIKVFGDIFGEL